MPFTRTSFIAYDDVASGSAYKERYGPEGCESTRIIQCDWDDGYLLAKDFMGYSVAVGSRVTRYLPELHPFYDYLHCIGIELVDALGVPVQDVFHDSMIYFANMVPGSGVIAGSGKARFSVRYASMPYDVGILSGTPEDETTLTRFVERQQAWAIENLPIPPGQLVYQATGTKVLETATRRFQTKQLTYTWHQAPGIPELGINNCMGKVNHVAFDGGTYAAETLLYVAPEVTPMRLISDLTTGLRHYTVKHNFVYKPEGWNYFPATNGDMVRVVYDADRSRGPYETADFSYLFKII